MVRPLETASVPTGVARAGRTRLRARIVQVRRDAIAVLCGGVEDFEVG